MRGNLDNLMKERDLSDYKVAKGSKVSQSSLSDWKNKGNVPRYETLAKLAEYFGVSVNYIIGDSPIISIPIISGRDVTASEEEINEILEEFANALGTYAVLTTKEKEIYSQLIEDFITILNYSRTPQSDEILMGHDIALACIHDSATRMISTLSLIISLSFDRYGKLINGKKPKRDISIDFVFKNNEDSEKL